MFAIELDGTSCNIGEAFMGGNIRPARKTLYIEYYKI